ncbi:MAG: FIG004694: Hypothetical protein, partial [uncultured Lysobacter sp.]
ISAAAVSRGHAAGDHARDRRERASAYRRDLFRGRAGSAPGRCSCGHDGPRACCGCLRATAGLGHGGEQRRADLSAAGRPSHRSDRGPRIRRACQRRAVARRVPRHRGRPACRQGGGRCGAWRAGGVGTPRRAFSAFGRRYGRERTAQPPAPAL